MLYRRRIEPYGKGWQVVEVWVNRNSKQYRVTDNSYDRKCLDRLINVLQQNKGPQIRLPRSGWPSGGCPPTRNTYKYRWPSILQGADPMWLFRIPAEPTQREAFSHNHPLTSKDLACNRTGKRPTFQISVPIGRSSIVTEGPNSINSPAFSLKGRCRA
jgi:hypothetical protein